MRLLCPFLVFLSITAHCPNTVAASLTHHFAHDPHPITDDIAKGKECYMKDMVTDFKKEREQNKDFETIFDNDNFRFTPKSVLKALRNCTTLYGDIRVSFVGSDQKGTEKLFLGEYVEAEDLKNLGNLKRINGSIYLELSEYPSIKSLDFFRNLREIRAGDFIVRRSQIEALNLTLVVMNVSNVFIDRNPRLCFLENFETNLVQKPNRRYIVQNNRNFSECKKEAKVCDTTCADSSGCLGPGKKRCAKCRAFRAGLKCVETCSPQQLGFYRRKGSRECGECHPECKWSCTGPRSSQCYSCKTAWDENKCVSKCPVEKFLDEKRRRCLNCSSLCAFKLLNDSRPLCKGERPEDCTHRCSGNEYVDRIDRTRRCSSCHPSCKGRCWGPNGKGCFSCETLLKKKLPELSREDRIEYLIWCIKELKQIVDNGKILVDIFGCAIGILSLIHVVQLARSIWKKYKMWNDRNSENSYKVRVKTGNSGAHGRIFISLFGSGNRSTGERELDNPEPGQTDVFNMKAVDVGDIEKLQVRHDGPAKLKLDTVHINIPSQGKIYMFKINHVLNKNETTFRPTAVEKIDRVRLSSTSSSSRSNSSNEAEAAATAETPFIENATESSQ